MTQATQTSTATGSVPGTSIRRRRGRLGNALTAHGEPMVWLTGGSLAVCLLMIIGLLVLVFYQGLATFWPAPLVRADLRGVLEPTEGHTVYLGEITRTESFPLQASTVAAMTGADQQPLRRRAMQLLEPAVAPALDALDDPSRLNYAIDAAREAFDQLNAAAQAGERTGAFHDAGGAVAALADVDAALRAVPTAPDAAHNMQTLDQIEAQMHDAEQAVIRDVMHLRQTELGGRIPEPDALAEMQRDPRFLALEHFGDELGSAKQRVGYLRQQVLMREAGPVVRQAVTGHDDPNTDVLHVLKDLQRSDEPGVGEAATFVMDHIQVEHRRRLFRTGNFDLTRRHFHWIPDYAIASESEPNWAVVIERLSWGRFFGVPTAFVAHTPREPGEREDRLAALQSLVTQGMRRVDGSQRQVVMQAYQRINRELAEVRRARSRAFLDRFEADPNRRIDLKLATGQTVRADEWDGQSAITEAIKVWAGSPAAWEQMRATRPDILERRRRHEQLQKQVVGSINAQLSDARLELRGAALAHDKGAFESSHEEDGKAGEGFWEGAWPVRDARRVTFQTRLVQPANRLISLESQVKAFRQQQDDNNALIDWVSQAFGADDALTTAAAAAAEAVNARADEQIAEAQQQIESVKAELAAAPQSVQAELAHFLAVARESTVETTEITGRMNELEAENDRYELRVETVQGQVQSIKLGEIVRIFPANQVTESLGDQMDIYLSRWGEFLTDEPRQANSEGGIFPAIIGTVLMTIIMAFAVVPFGVMAALYLREYARGGIIVSAVRIAINNLAGVPSIVFGVFGLGFFCYVVGDFVDAGPVYELPAGRWFGYLGVLAGAALLGALLFFLSLSRPGKPRSRTQFALRYAAGGLWLVASIALILLVAVTPFFDGFFEARKLAENQPTFGKGALVWASLTLALLTLPVVIVATEEALAAVPNSMREGSYACGASKWQTIKRIVLPRAMPGIMTGMILAMARGAGEVAPLMLVGAVKLAPELPISADPGEAFGINRSFMHLGFHIYDLGFQSQNSEAAKPMVFTTTLLLIAIVAVLNLSAIWLRTRLRQKFVASAF